MPQRVAVWIYWQARAVVEGSPGSSNTQTLAPTVGEWSATERQPKPALTLGWVPCPSTGVEGLTATNAAVQLLPALLSNRAVKIPGLSSRLSRTTSSILVAFEAACTCRTP